MSSKALTTASILQCPHGGVVEMISSYPTVAAAAAPVATIADTFLVKGCPHVIFPGPIPVPMPCVSVKWVRWDTIATVNGNPTLSEGSVGLCMNAAQMPQGNVSVQQTQTILSP